MSEQKTLTDKLNSLLFGEPIPIFSGHDLDTIHHLDAKLDKLLTLLNTSSAAGEQLIPPLGEEASGFGAPKTDVPKTGVPKTGVPKTNAQNQEVIGDLSEQVRKLAKTQFKANTLQETQLAQQQETIAGLQQSIGRQEKRQAEFNQQRRQAIETAQLDVILTLLPILDSLDAAFESGRRQVLKRPMPGETRQAIIAWLDGIRLARMRLQDVLKTHNVAPIPTVGEPFDPNRHVAVATDSSGQAPEGTIVSEDQRGYTTPEKVLRFAKVVVAQSN